MEQNDKRHTEKHWYAFRIVRGWRIHLLAKFKMEGQEYYVIRQAVNTLSVGNDTETNFRVLFPNLIFLRTTAVYAEKLPYNPDYQVVPYTMPGSRSLAIIDDREMEIFQMMLRYGGIPIDVVDEKLAKGDRVRVTAGAFTGAEGYIVRIKGDHRFVVAIKGVAAIATTYIPKKFLEKVEQIEEKTPVNNSILQEIKK